MTVAAILLTIAWGYGLARILRSRREFLDRAHKNTLQSLRKQERSIEELQASVDSFRERVEAAMESNNRTGASDDRTGAPDVPPLTKAAVRRSLPSAGSEGRRSPSLRFGGPLFDPVPLSFERLYGGWRGVSGLPKGGILNLNISPEAVRRLGRLTSDLYELHVHTEDETLSIRIANKLGSIAQFIDHIEAAQVEGLPKRPLSSDPSWGHLAALLFVVASPTPDAWIESRFPRPHIRKTSRQESSKSLGWVQRSTALT